MPNFLCKGRNIHNEAHKVSPLDPVSQMAYYLSSDSNIYTTATTASSSCLSYSSDNDNQHETKRLESTLKSRHIKVGKQRLAARPHHQGRISQTHRKRSDSETTSMVSEANHIGSLENNFRLTNSKRKSSLEKDKNNSKMKRSDHLSLTPNRFISSMSDQLKEDGEIDYQESRQRANRRANLLNSLRPRRSALNGRSFDQISTTCSERSRFHFVGGVSSNVALNEANPCLARKYYHLNQQLTRKKSLKSSSCGSIESERPKFSHNHHSSSEKPKEDNADTNIVTKQQLRQHKLPENMNISRLKRRNATRTNKRMIAWNNDDSYFLNPYALSELFSQSEIPGFREIFASDSYLRKFVWIVAFLILTVASLNDVTELVTEYFEFPITVGLRLRDEPRLPFPSVTVCNLNVVRYTALCSPNSKTGPRLTNQIIPSELRDRLCGYQIDQTNKNKTGSSDMPDINDINNIGIVTTSTAAPTMITTTTTTGSPTGGGGNNTTTTSTTTFGSTIATPAGFPATPTNNLVTVAPTSGSNNNSSGGSPATPGPSDPGGGTSGIANNSTANGTSTTTSRPAQAAQQTTTPSATTTNQPILMSKPQSPTKPSGALDLGDFSVRPSAILQRPTSSSSRRNGNKRETGPETRPEAVIRGPYSARNTGVNVGAGGGANVDLRKAQVLTSSATAAGPLASTPSSQADQKSQQQTSVNRPTGPVGQSALSRSPPQNDRQGHRNLMPGATSPSPPPTIADDTNSGLTTPASPNFNLVNPSLIPEEIGHNEGTDRELQENLTNWLAVLNQRDSDLTLSLGHQFEDMILRCMMKYKNCSHERNFVTTFTPTEGNCFTYKSKMRSPNSPQNELNSGRHYDEINLAGANQGLELVLNLEKNEYLTGSSQVGALVIVHHPGDSGYAASEATFIAPEFTTYIGLKMVNITRLPAPHPEKCVKTWPKKFADAMTRNRTYSQQACLKTCLQKTIQSHCQCQSATLPILDMDSDEVADNNDEPASTDNRYQDNDINSTLATTNNTSSSSSSWSPAISRPRIIICDTRKQSTRQCVTDVTLRATERVHNCDCPPKCQVVRYDKTVSMARWPTREDKVTFDRSKVDFNFKNLAKVIVYFQTMTCDEITQQAVYNGTKLFSSLGGIMGMYVGFSFLSVFEIFEVISRKTWHHYRMKLSNKRS